MEGDKKLIDDLGGPARVAELLGYPKHGGIQRVQNWTTRGIPAKVRLAHPQLFQTVNRRATDPVPSLGHGGRQPPSPTNILDTVPCGAVVIASHCVSHESK